MKVAINATALAPGGGLTGLLGYLRAWERSGHSGSIRLYASRSAVIDAIEGVARGVVVVPYARDKGWIKRSALSLLSLGRLIARDGADVVMTTNFLVPGCRLPQLVHHRNLKHFQARYRGLTRLNVASREGLRDLSARRAVSRATVNVFVSGFLRHEAERFAPLPLGRTYVIHNGLDDSVINAAAHVDLSVKVAGRIIAVTSDSPHKDNATAIRVLAALIRNSPDVAWELVVVGGGAFVAERSLATALGVDSRVTFTGFLLPDQLDHEYRRATYALFTTQLESFGNGVIEAMARKCLVIASDIAAIPEIAGSAGVLIKPGDVDAFCKAILVLSKSQMQALNQIDAGLARIQDFRWQNSAQSMWQLLEMARVGA